MPLNLSRLGGVLAGVAVIAQAGLFAWLVDVVVFDEPPLRMLVTGFALLLAAIGVRAAGQYLQDIAGFAAGRRVRERARAAVLDHLAAVGPAGLSAQPTGDIAARAIENVEALHGYYARFLPQVTTAVVVPVAIVLVVFAVDWLAAVFLLAAAPLIPAFMVLVGMGAARLNREQFEAVNRLAGRFLDRVRGLSTLQLFGYGRASLADVVQASDGYRHRSLRTLRVAFLSSAVLEFFASVAVAAVAIYVGFGLLGYIDYGPAPDLTLFSGLFVLMLAPEFFQPLRTLSQHYHDRAAALGAAEGLLALLRLPAREPAAHPVSASGDALFTLTDVTVDREGYGTILGPVSMTVPANRCTVLWGPSGSGKTTLLRVLAGFETPVAGDCRRSAGLSREPRFAWLGQTPYIQAGSVAANLRLAAPQATGSAMFAALEAVGLAAAVRRLPAGLDTDLGERGEGLSGGQCRRLALARVLLCAHPLALLDEPTAGLDPDSADIVRAALGLLVAEGRSVIIATHDARLKSLAGAVVSLAEVASGQRRV